MDVQKELTQMLVKAYNQANFEMLFEFLDEDVKRTTSWGNGPILGKDAVIAYFHEKENEMLSTNHHYLAKYAETTYQNGKPRTVPLAGGMAGNEPIEPGSIGMLWYMEHEPMVTIRNTDNKAIEVVVSLTINSSQKISEIHIGNPNIYFLLETEDHVEMDDKTLSYQTAEKIKASLCEKGYTISIDSNHKEWATELNVQTPDRNYSLLIFVDHFPFFGVIPNLIKNYVSMMSYYKDMDFEFALVQAIGKGSNPARIENGDAFDIQIMQQAPFTTLRFKKETTLDD